MLPTKRSAVALARGARTGVLMMRMSAAVNTASKALVNLASRVAAEELDAAPDVVEVQKKVPGLLGQPRRRSGER